MYFKHNKFASISPICFRLPEQTVEQPRDWGVESDEANLPPTRSHHYLSSVIDIVTSEAELLSRVEDAYTQEDGRKVVRSLLICRCRY